jgi:hypothetical protein
VVEWIEQPDLSTAFQSVLAVRRMPFSAMVRFAAGAITFSRGVITLYVTVLIYYAWLSGNPASAESRRT